MSRAEYKVINGDVTRPANEGSRSIIVPHIVNDAGRWGSGVVNAITERWGEAPRQYYREWFEGKNLTDVYDVFFDKTPASFELGRVQFIRVPNHILIANMVAQSNIKEEGNDKPIRYEALIDCMRHVRKVAKVINADIDAPKFGTVRSGGNWDFIEELICEMWVNNNLNVTIYEFS
jgi:O-acetyl-ADP-ribose deacetylase (regulator of RNase III)